MRILKYHFDTAKLTPNTPLVLPAGSLPRHVGVQHNKFMIWAEVPENPGSKAIHVTACCTGDAVPELAVYLGSASSDFLGLVLHFFWRYA